MSRGFYELLSVAEDAPAAAIRSAYGAAVTALGRRRRRLVEQGGDPSGLDYERARLDEAWATLSDSLGRRRYDALCAWSADSSAPRGGDALWAWAAPRVSPPAAAVAVKLLRKATRLERLEALPLSPSASEADPPTLIPHDDDRTHSGGRPAPSHADLTAPGFRPSEAPTTSEAAPVIVMPRARPARRPEQKVVSLSGDAPKPELRVVDGASSASEVLVLPSKASRDSGALAARAMSSEDIARMVDAHGYTGALLRAVREARGLTLDKISADSRISLKYLEALEADDFGSLPSATFVRGYVRELARQLRLDVDAVVSGYMRRFSG